MSSELHPSHTYCGLYYIQHLPSVTRRVLTVVQAIKQAHQVSAGAVASPSPGTSTFFGMARMMGFGRTPPGLPCLSLNKRKLPISAITRHTVLVIDIVHRRHCHPQKQHLQYDLSNRRRDMDGESITHHASCSCIILNRSDHVHLSVCLSVCLFALDCIIDPTLKWCYKTPPKREGSALTAEHTSFLHFCLFGHKRL